MFRIHIETHATKYQPVVLCITMTNPALINTDQIIEKVARLVNTDTEFTGMSIPTLFFVYPKEYTYIWTNTSVDNLLDLFTVPRFAAFPAAATERSLDLLM